MSFRLALLLVAALAVPATAQIDLFTWQFSSPPGQGSGFISSNGMHISGPDGGMGTCGPLGSTASFTAVAPYDLVIIADYNFSNGDKGGPGFDYFVTLVDGVATEVADWGCWDCRLVLEVPAGATFGFGVHATDCQYGEGTLTITNLRVLPDPGVLVVDGLEAGERYGSAVTGVGGLDADGVPDFASATPLSDSVATDAGRVELVSGANGMPLGSLYGAAGGDRFGEALAAGDVDEDGVSDLIVGIPGADGGGVDAGAVSVYSGADRGLLHHLPGAAPGDGYGSAVAAAGDVDGDGSVDLLVGAPLHDGAGSNSGLVRLVSGADGATLREWLGSAAGDELGRSVAGVGDVDGDGFGDVLAGAPFADVLASNSGRAMVWSGATGGLLHALTQEPCNTEANDNFGRAVAGIGDVNRDEVPDLAVSAPGDWCYSAIGGSIAVFSGASGDLLHVIPGNGADYKLGNVLAAAGDANLDGVPDLVAGTSGALVDHAFVFSGDDGELIFAYAGEAPLDGFGAAVADMGDLDGDGRADIVIGAPRSDARAADAGRARAFTSALLWTDLGQGSGGLLGPPVLSGQGLLHGGSLVELTISNAPPHVPATLVLGTGALYAPFKGGVLVPNPSVLFSLFLVTGTLELGATWPTGLPSGVQLWLQAWVADFTAPSGSGGTNGLLLETP